MKINFPYSGNGNSLFTIEEKATCNFYRIPILKTFMLGKDYQMHDRILNSEWKLLLDTEIIRLLHDFDFSGIWNKTFWPFESWDGTINLLEPKKS